MKLFRLFSTVAATVCLAALLPAARHARGQEPSPETIAVSQTYNNAPFHYTMRPLAERALFRVYRLTYPSPVASPVEQNNTIPADFYLPRNFKNGDAKRPAVICLHILDGNEPLTELMCSVLAARGIPAISFKLPYYGSRGLPKGPALLAEDPQRFVGAIAQAGEDIRRTIDLLASRPEVDSQRIGITGVSLGGIIAASAVGADPRLHRAGLILAGGDLLDIIHHARETRPLSAMIRRLSAKERSEVEAKIAAADPVRFAPALRERALAGNVLMVNAAEDEVIPRRCTERLAESMGIADRVVWLPGLGHYTAMAELPRALKITADFFARDLPEGVLPPAISSAAEPGPVQRLASFLRESVVLGDEPAEGRCHLVHLDVSILGPDRRPMEARVRLVRGTGGKFSLRCDLPGFGKAAIGQGAFPWIMAGDKTLLAGSLNPIPNGDVRHYVVPRHLLKLRMLGGIVNSLVMVPDMLLRWVAVEDAQTSAGERILRVAAKDPKAFPGELRIAFREDGKTPKVAEFAADGVHGLIRFHGWQANAAAADALFEPAEERPRRNVDQSDVYRVFAAMWNYAAERAEPPRAARDASPNSLAIVARDPAGHGILCRWQRKTILMVDGSPSSLGAAHGALLRDPVRKLAERVVYLVGGGDTLRSGEWFFERMADIERRTLPHIPRRFIEECDALSQAAGVSRRDGRFANLFPERFHCSGAALKGKATAGGRVLHARVLDYMRDIGLQESAVAMLFMPEGRHAWISVGYAGFIGTVTAMNEKGLSVGEMGGRGEGRWDGIPMNFLLRDIMERADNVDQALAILRAAPRTCEYYYVLSDRSGTIRAVECTPENMTVLEPGQQHPRLPRVPDDVVFVSGKDRALLLSQRIEQEYGRIDVPRLIEIIKRPVAMPSNLHNAIFAPETLDLWFSDAGDRSPACDEPYARVNLRELIDFYRRQQKAPASP